MTTEKKLKSGIYADARGICKEAAALFDMEFEPNAMELIGELTWKKLLLYGQDLEAFHKHGKRSAITVDDVKLLCRRNPSLKEFIEKECPTTSKTDASAANKKKRKASAPIMID